MYACCTVVGKSCVTSISFQNLCFLPRGFSYSLIIFSSPRVVFLSRQRFNPPSKVFSRNPVNPISFFFFSYIPPLSNKIFFPRVFFSLSYIRRPRKQPTYFFPLRVFHTPISYLFILIEFLFVCSIQLKPGLILTYDIDWFPSLYY